MFDTVVRHDAAFDVLEFRIGRTLLPAVRVIRVQENELCAQHGILRMNPRSFVKEVKLQTVPWIEFAEYSGRRRLIAPQYQGSLAELGRTIDFPARGSLAIEEQLSGTELFGRQSRRWCSQIIIQFSKTEVADNCRKWKK
jgi:hypothetical protein